MVAPETNVPMSRYHCPGCHHTGRAPLGQDSATCDHCGRTIANTGTMLALLGLAHQALAAERRRAAYARADVELAFLLNKLPLELAVERQRGKVS